MVLGVIPARGGSVRVVRKNERLYRGKSLLQWAVECARASRLDAFVVSTEDPDITAAALALGCPVLNRPPELASHSAKSEAVLTHALTTLRADWGVLLQPTSPLRLPSDIDAAVTLALAHQSPVVSYGPQGKNGAVYVASLAWLKEHDFSHPHLHYEMPATRSLDIDVEADFA